MLCKFCGRDMPLRNSHIIPEFFFKPLYDQKHRFVKVSLSQPSNGVEQKGIREKMLCDDCEGRFSKYEDYVRRLFYGGTQIGISDGNPVVFRNVDYRLFKLFYLSVLWRAHHSAHDFFRDISLGKIEQRIKEKLKMEDPGKRYEFPCLLILLLMDDQPLDALIARPRYMKYDNFRLVRFLMGGCMWMIFTSKHSDQLEFALKSMTVDKEGEISVYIKKADDTRMIQELALDVAQAEARRNKSSL